MLLLIVAVLGVVEGLTEFLPISSTGHLVVASSLLGFAPEWKEPFLVVIQLGAIAAIVVARGGEILGLLKQGTQTIIALGIRLFLGFFPSAVLGLLVHHAISELLKNPRGVAAAWVVGGVIILLLDKKRDGVAHAAGAEDLLKITPRQSLLVGLAQCLSLFPGMSRSGSTIIGGLAVGLDRPTATLFSFYLAIPTMLAASAYELKKNAGHLSGSGAAFAVGMIVSFAVALATVRWLLKFVQSHTFRGFAIYRLIAGAVIAFSPAAWWSAE
ncbi:MAG: undecaprenyl-diphosphate phosphatase [Myxococcota bacterium]